jgi:hypothetical protein
MLSLNTDTLYTRVSQTVVHVPLVVHQPLFNGAQAY